MARAYGTSSGREKSFAPPVSVPFALHLSQAEIALASRAPDSLEGKFWSHAMVRTLQNLLRKADGRTFRWMRSDAARMM